VRKSTFVTHIDWEKRTRRCTRENGLRMDVRNRARSPPLLALSSVRDIARKREKALRFSQRSEIGVVYERSISSTSV